MILSSLGIKISVPTTPLVVPFQEVNVYVSFASS
jgi:hypothetical protein